METKATEMTKFMSVLRHDSIHYIINYWPVYFSAGTAKKSNTFSRGAHIKRLPCRQQFYHPVAQRLKRYRRGQLPRKSYRILSLPLKRYVLQGPNTFPNAAGVSSFLTFLFVFSETVTVLWIVPCNIDRVLYRWGLSVKERWPVRTSISRPTTVRALPPKL